MDWLEGRAAEGGLGEGRGAQASRQRVEAARKLYVRALEVDKGHEQSLLGLASLEARSGNTKEAIQLYERGLAAHPRNLHILHSMAQLYRQIGNPEVGPKNHWCICHKKHTSLGPLTVARVQTCLHRPAPHPLGITPFCPFWAWRKGASVMPASFTTRQYARFCVSVC